MYGYRIEQPVYFKTATLGWTPGYVVSFVGGGYVEVRMPGKSEVTVSAAAVVQIDVHPKNSSRFCALSCLQYTVGVNELKPGP
jgi:hypothetical protein